MRTRRREESDRREQTPAPRAVSTDSRMGGCVLVSGSRDVTITNVAATGGRAMRGSGIAVVDSVGVTVSGSSFYGNGVILSESTALYGGGGYFDNSTVGIAGTKFNGNWLANTGLCLGGGASFQKCVVRITGSTEASGNWLRGGKNFGRAV